MKAQYSRMYDEFPNKKHSPSRHSRVERTKKETVMEIKNIFIIGAGFMGKGIAQVAIQSGFNVSLNDVDDSKLNDAYKEISYRIERNISKGRISESEGKNCLKRLALASDYQSISDHELIIEAIYEDLNAKQEIYKKIEPLCNNETIIASNTSSISLTALASVLNKRDRFVGMHFFSPVPVMKLLEIIGGLETSRTTLEIVKEVGNRLEKVMIVSKDMPGFIVNRLLIPMLNEAVQILDEGIGTVEDIDAGMRYGCNHPMGPFELIDMTGLDIILAIMEVLYNELGDSKYRPAPLLRKLVRAGFLGKKTGKGFYIYDSQNDNKIVNPALLTLTM